MLSSLCPSDAQVTWFSSWCISRTASRIVKFRRFIADPGYFKPTTGLLFGKALLCIDERSCASPRVVHWLGSFVGTLLPRYKEAVVGFDRFTHGCLPSDS